MILNKGVTMAWSAKGTSGFPWVVLAFILRCVVVEGEGSAYGLIVFLGIFKKKLFLASSEGFET